MSAPQLNPEALRDLHDTLAALVDRDLSYQGNSIVITCQGQGWAIKRVHEARVALAKARKVHP